MRATVPLILFTLIKAASAEDKPCTAHDNGKFYDLNPLRLNKDYELKTPGDHKLVFNVCGRIQTETFGMKDEDPAKIAGFLRRDHGDISIGALNTTVAVHEGRPRLYFLNGSPCTKSDDGDDDEAKQLRASSVIDFVCDTSVFGSGKPRLVAAFPLFDEGRACQFAIEWRTHLACATSEGGGTWGTLAIVAVLFLLIFLVYAVLGTLYNRYVLNLRGFDQIPQFSAESMRYHAAEAWDWIKDLYSSSYHSNGFSSYQNWAGSGEHGVGYQPAPTSPPPRPAGASNIDNPRSRAQRTNPVSHHVQTEADAELGLRPGSSTEVAPPSDLHRPRPLNKPRPELETNPVSHFTQSQAQLQSQASAAGGFPSTGLSRPGASSSSLSSSLKVNTGTPSGQSHQRTASGQSQSQFQTRSQPQQLHQDPPAPLITTADTTTPTHVQPSANTNTSVSTSADRTTNTNVQAQKFGLGNGDEDDEEEEEGDEDGEDEDDEEEDDDDDDDGVGRGQSEAGALRGRNLEGGGVIRL